MVMEEETVKEGMDTVWPVLAMNADCGNPNVTGFDLVKRVKQQTDVSISVSGVANMLTLADCTYSLTMGKRFDSGTRIKILEERLRRARAYLAEAQKRAPSLARINFDALLSPFDDCRLPSTGEAERSGESDEEEILDSMMDSYGKLAINHDTQTTKEFFGASSGLAFIQRTKEQPDTKQWQGIPSPQLAIRYALSITINSPENGFLPSSGVATRLGAVEWLLTLSFEQVGLLASDIQKTNPTVPEKNIQVGQSILIPINTVTIKAGDTVSDLCQKNNPKVTVAQGQVVNPGVNLDSINPDQKINFPRKT
ncbi:Gypsy retrotransposon integrase-like protein 1 [Neophaeococcomyces mojaviensis]|uniref:Gypsy retrotransposon integrase-like protein 1 n=1 Tax=Neophaeococcomyces mojaviensis TaxID=3383035 RepID=A0ACC3ABZ6_9EURO|nr:Gypsy retrotransposon integrase-like protein 1 [Knufia sp. JES_112]